MAAKWFCPTMRHPPRMCSRFMREPDCQLLLFSQAIPNVGYRSFPFKAPSFLPPTTTIRWQELSILAFIPKTTPSFSIWRLAAPTKPCRRKRITALITWQGLQIRRVVTPDIQLAFLKPGLVANARSSFKRTKQFQAHVRRLHPGSGAAQKELAPISFKAGAGFGFSFIINDKDDEVAGRKRGLTLTPQNTEPFGHPELFPVVTLRP
jgi:hypothetical protein